jgi:tetratricopeptide (TPR) repeat protein
MMPVNERLQLGITLHQRGDLARAQEIYREILGQFPRHFRALHLSGVLASQTANPELAARLIWKAIEINPAHAGAFCDLGSALKQLNRLEAALASYDKAISLDPKLAEAHANRGVVLTELNKPDAALASLNRAIALKADFAAAHLSRGIVLNLLRRFDEALHSYEQAIAINPAYAEAHFHKGELLRSAGRWDAALASLEAAVSVRPSYVEAWVNCGLVLREKGELDAALAHFDRAVALDGRCAEAFSNRGVLLGQLKRFDLALASFDRALSIKPDYAEACCNKGNVLRELDRFDAALECYRQAILLKSPFPEAHSSLGVALTALGRFDEAFASFDAAIAQKPDYAEAYMNRAMASLMLGRFDSGWKDYEWRRKRKNVSAVSARRSFAVPSWLGDTPIAGRRILLWWEQGLGDTLQFCRYAPLVADLGATVVLQVQPQLLGVLATLPGIEHLVGAGDALPEFDCHCPLMSLPLAFGTALNTIPSAGRYLASDPARVDRWRTKLGERFKPRIGLVWSGSRENRNDRNRSMSLSLLLQYLPEEFQYVSLQKDVRDADRAALAARPDILDCAVDFPETAALCECLDLVISVDTSVAHLSAAIGKKTWILLPSSADWRWLLDRDDTPWYDAVRLYRQDRAGGWIPALSKLRTDLRQTLT